MNVSPRLDALADGLVLGVLILDGALLGAFGLLFNPLYTGSVPVPMGTLLSILILPWLIMRAAEINPRRGAAAAPFVAWGVSVAVLGLFGPGGDVLLPVTWQSVLLCAGGLGAGCYGLRRAEDH